MGGPPSREMRPQTSLELTSNSNGQYSEEIKKNKKIYYYFPSDQKRWRPAESVAPRTHFVRFFIFGPAKATWGISQPSAQTSIPFPAPREIHCGRPAAAAAAAAVGCGMVDASERTSASGGEPLPLPS